MSCKIETFYTYRASYREVIAFSVPAWNTFIALEANNIEAAHEMLVYWYVEFHPFSPCKIYRCVHACLHVIETVSDTVYGHS